MEQYPIVMASSPELHRQDPSPDTLAPCHDEDPADYVRDFVARLIDQATNDLCTCDSPWPTKAELFFDSPESTYPACLRRAVLITQYLTCAAKCLRDFETFSGGLDFMIWEARQYAPCRYTDHDVMELLEYNINDVWRASRFAQLTRLLYPSRRQAWIGGENEFMAHLDPEAVPTLYEGAGMRACYACVREKTGMLCYVMLRQGANNKGSEIDQHASRPLSNREPGR